MCRALKCNKILLSGVRRAKRKYFCRYLVPVAVLVAVSEPRVLENEVVVAPRGVGGVVGVAAEVLVQELGRAPEGAGAAQGLRRCCPVSCTRRVNN